ncbi:MAG: hypothetical protein VCC04_04360, partial [Myxococcota bacterium]
MRAPQEITFRADLLLVAMSGRGARVPVTTIKEWGSSVAGLWDPVGALANHLDKSQINKVVRIALEHLECHSHIAIDWGSRNVAVSPTTWVRDWPDSQNHHTPRWHLVGARCDEHANGLQTEEMHVDRDFELDSIGGADCTPGIRLPDLLTYEGDPTGLFEAETLGDEAVPGAWCHAEPLGGARGLMEELERTVEVGIREPTNVFVVGQFLNVEQGRFTPFSELPGG